MQICLFLFAAVTIGSSVKLAKQSSVSRDESVAPRKMATEYSSVSLHRIDKIQRYGILGLFLCLCRVRNLCAQRSGRRRNAYCTWKRTCPIDRSSPWVFPSFHRSPVDGKQRRGEITKRRIKCYNAISKAQHWTSASPLIDCTMLT